LGETSGKIESFTASDGYRCCLRRYYPEGKPRANVVCIHGIQSHAGWYGYSCDRLRQAGFAVDFLDRRGSGLNQVARGDAPSFRRLREDLAEYLQTVRRSQPAPALIFLASISWGGKLAVALARRHPELVDGLVLMSPGFCPRVRPPWSQRLAILCSRFVRPDRFFPIPLNDPELFTAIPRWQEFIRNDPLLLRQATARLLVESSRLDTYLRIFGPSVDRPILLLLAQADRIIDNAKTRAFIGRFAATDKQVIEYAGAHHTLEFEPDRDRFIDDWLCWMNRIIAPDPAGARPLP
jgi:alpha-beta hydrolase superfamily lysophospholipase